jgi:hypothetical protein
MRHIFCTLFFLIGISTASAQVLTLPTEPDKFIEEYTKQTEKQLGVGIQPVNAQFVSLFQNTLDAGGKKEAVSLIIMLSKKGLKPADLVKFTEMFTGFQQSQNPSTGEFAAFLNGLIKSFEPFPAKTILETSGQLAQFLKDNTLYNSQFNSIKISQSKPSLKFFDKKQSYFTETSPAAAQPAEVVDIGWDENVEEYDPWKDGSTVKSTAIESRINLPQVQGLYFVFENVNLTFLSPSDSIVLQGTSGAYNFVDGIFIGSGGSVFWSVNNSQVKVVLNQYSFKSSSGKLVAEKVSLEHPEVIKKPLEGAFEIKLEKRAKGEPSTFPRFKSYHNDADYVLALENYEFTGGYTLVGQKITTSSIFDRYSRLLANKGSKTNEFEVIGQSITVTDTLISSDMVSFVARFGVDSVSHPAIRLAFDVKNQHVQLNKVQRGGFRQSMFSDTFHQVDIRCDAMSWDLKSGKMDFYIVAAKQEVAAEFESFDYFNMARLSSLSSAAGFNPLMAAATLIGRKKKNIITIEEMMQITKKERYMVSNGMLIGNQMGFFDYHPFGNYYTISRKGLHYYFVATGKKDFDNLVFSSLNRSGGAQKNASIDFTSKSLDITGAQNFKLSDSLGIRLLPNNESMKVIGNKVFSFDGRIQVKNYTFYGDFVLEYEKFMVNLKRIDSITFIPLDIYNKGGKLELAGNFEFGSSGTLYLNSPDNKSGRKNLPEFPKLEIPDGVTVKFNERGRSHKFSDEVVFKASSLKLDSLNSKDPSIAGLFTTGGIFKPIKDNLVMVADSSMGMSHMAMGAYPVYNGQTTLKTDSKIILDKKGITTSGEIIHLAANLNVEKIRLLEEYSEATGKSGKISEKEIGAVYFPSVAISEFSMHWNPSKDSMAIYSEKGFDFYNSTTSLKGSLVMRTAGLFGSGELGRADSDIASKNFKFDRSGFLAEKASIQVKALGEENKVAFSGKNLNINFNVQNSLVKISSENKDFNTTEVAFLEFPYSSYKTTIDNALWNIKDKLITMEGTIENSTFTSTAQNQYGLKFNGTGAKYDIAAKNLSITGVEEIHTADAAIKPLGGKVFVKNDGKLESFANATILVDTLNRYHTLTKASVTVNSRLSFAGNADYQYVNVSSDTFNIKLGGFEFAEITPEGQILNSKGSGKLSTIAKATVSENDQVFLAKKMLYRGDLTMLAPFKNLSLKGQVLPDLKRYPMIGGSWIDYQGSKSENVTINIDESLKDGGKPLYVGLHLKYGANSDGIYPSFLSMKGSSDDTDIFQARGVFGRDEPNQKFYVTPADESGNGAEFYEEQGVLKLSGNFNLLGVPTKVFETVGTATVRLDSMKYLFETMMVYDFPIPIPTVQKMGQNIVKANLDAGNTAAAIEPNVEEFMLKLKKYIGAADAEKYKSESEKGHVPLFKRSNKFLKSLVLSKLNLKWNPTANAYYSEGPVGISNLGDVDINALVNGYVEIVQSHSTGNEVNVYLDLSANSWYYFVYRNGQLGIVSSDEEVNKMLNTSGGKEKEKGVNFIDINEATRFKKRFLINYQGMTEEDFDKRGKTQAKPPVADTKKTKAKEESEGF